jgi:tetratricopeptide (TPR) repeat protein
MKKGLEYLHKAVQIDPAEPFAHAGLALGYLEIAHGPLNPGDAYMKAESAALQAIKLDPDLAEAQLALAELNMYSTWNYSEAERYFRRAIELNPYLSMAHYHYAWLLMLLGRRDEAEVEHELAQKYDPFNPMIVGHMGILYAYLGRFDDAIREVNKSFGIQKACPDGYFALVETYLAQGRDDEAISACRTFVEGDPVWKWVLGYTYASTGYRQEAEQVLKELLNEKITSWNALGIAGIYGNMGNMEEAYRWMGYEPHHAWVPWLTVMYVGKPFWKDERFKEFKKKWNLSDI